MALIDHYRTIYGRGNKPDLARCCEIVDGTWHYNQCSRKNGHGPDGAYCKQHDPEAVASRKAAADAEYRRKRKAELPRVYAHSLAAALRQIADGHTDPRGLAIETLKVLE